MRGYANSPGMCTILLMRHAKSSWSDPDLDDHERPLNDRGIAASKRMAKWMEQHGEIPDFVLTSTARRAKDTWQLVSQALNLDVPSAEVSDMYLAGPDAMLNVVRSRVPKGTKKLLLIGHQPGISSFARLMANSSARASRARAYQRFPTAALAVIRNDVDDWADLAFGKGDFCEFAVPKELEGN